MAASRWCPYQNTTFEPSFLRMEILRSGRASLATDNQLPKVSVSAGVGLAGHKDAGSAGGPARLMGKGVKDSGYCAIGSENAQDYDAEDG